MIRLRLLLQLLFLRALLPGSTTVVTGGNALSVGFQDIYYPDQLPLSVVNFTATPDTPLQARMPLEGDEEKAEKKTTQWRSILVGTGATNVDSAKAHGKFCHIICPPIRDLRGSTNLNVDSKCEAQADWEKAPPLLEADHVFEVQILVAFLKKAGIEDLKQALGDDVIDKVKEALNADTNSIMISLELNRLKGGIFTKVLKSFISADGKPVDCRLPMQKWRNRAMVSALTYIVARCAFSFGTAMKLQEILRARFAAGKWGVTDLKEEWLDVGDRYGELLSQCLYTMVEFKDGFKSVCERRNDFPYKIVDI